jgi:purine-nucleoside phosphorylase
MLEKIKKIAAFIQDVINDTPDYAIVLGSGLGKLQDEVETIHTLEYAQIPDFPQTTVVGHSGKLIYGMLEGKKVLMMSGRLHYYEGHSIENVVLPIRVFHLLGIKNLILSNASGGVNSEYKIADIAIIKDHINMMPEHPLRGRNIDSFGPRFVDMSEAYSKKMISIAEKVASENHINIHQGIYVALQGPTFETPAEYGMIKGHWWRHGRNEHRSRSYCSQTYGNGCFWDFRDYRSGRTGYCFLCFPRRSSQCCQYGDA